MKQRNDYTDETLALAIDKHLSETFRVCFRAAPETDYTETPHYKRVVTGLPTPFGNIVWDTALDESDLDAQIAAVLAPVRARKVPALWLVGPATASTTLCERLVASGLHAHSPMPGMVLSLDALTVPPIPTNVVIEEIRDTAGADAWCETLAVGYELPHEAARLFGDAPKQQGFGDAASLRLFLARQNGVPVACAMLHLADDLAGIYCVATVAEARNQGIGAAVTAEALDAGRRAGYRVGVLEASTMGLPIYRRLGFEEVCQIAIFVDMPDDFAVWRADFASCGRFSVWRARIFAM